MLNVPSYPTAWWETYVDIKQKPAAFIMKIIIKVINKKVRADVEVPSSLCNGVGQPVTLL